MLHDMLHDSLYKFVSSATLIISGKYNCWKFEDVEKGEACFKCTHENISFRSSYEWNKAEILKKITNGNEQSFLYLVVHRNEKNHIKNVRSSFPAHFPFCTIRKWKCVSRKLEKRKSFNWIQAGLWYICRNDAVFDTCSFRLCHVIIMKKPRPTYKQAH